MQAQLAYQNKDFKAAKEVLEQYHKAIRPSAVSMQLAGAVDFQLGAYTQAQDNLAKALTAESTLPLARRLLVSTYLNPASPRKPWKP